MNKEAIKETLLNFIVPLVAVGICAALFLFVILPGIKTNPEKLVEVDKARALNTQLTEKLDNLNKIESYETVIKDYETLVSKVLLSKPMVPELLTQVDTIAKESGLEVTKLTYSFTEAAKVEKEGPDYPLVNVSLGATGNYEQLVAFFENIEKAARFVYVDNFRFSEEKTDKKTALAIQVSLSAPYLEVESKAVTDEPIKIDITDQKFISFIDKLKKLKYYEPVVNIDVSNKATEEEPESAPESAPETPPETPPTDGAPQAPVAPPLL